MSATAVFAIGVMGTLGIAQGVVWYLKRPMQKILVELCGNEERAAFWSAFSAVAMGSVPIIFAINCRPTPGPGAPAVFELADQLKWGLIGMLGTLLALGWVIGRSIVRWERQARAKS